MTEPTERDLEMARDLERVMALPLRALVEKWKGHAVFSKVTNSTRSDIVSPFYVKVQDVTALIARAREEQRERAAEMESERDALLGLLRLIDQGQVEAEWRPLLRSCMDFYDE